MAFYVKENFVGRDGIFSSKGPITLREVARMADTLISENRVLIQIVLFTRPSADTIAGPQ